VKSSEPLGHTGIVSGKGPHGLDEVP